MKLKLLFFIASFCAATVVASAQVDRATLTGTLRDASGAVVSGAALTVTYPLSGLVRNAESNDSGLYFITGLPVGSVLIEAKKTGFQPIQSEVKLSVGETRSQDFTFALATISASIQVLAEPELVRNTAVVGTTFENAQIGSLPINGRNWSNLTTLVPGAVDTGGSNVRFLGHGGDDSNLRIDGVDATSVRNQTQKSRLLVSTDAIAEFRVNSALYTAEAGGANGGQVEIVSRGGTNQFHGSVFEYLRNSAFDSRSPFDIPALPAFRLNQFGGVLGGPILRDRTFFFASYEGLVQRQGLTQIGFVPSASFRASTVPSVRPILDLYPIGLTPTAGATSASVMRWNGVGSSRQDEHTGLMRLDHRFNDSLNSYFRFSTNRTNISSPNLTIPITTSNLDAPTSGLFDFLFLVSPRTTNEVRLAANYAQPLNSSTQSPIDIAIAVPSFSTIPAGTRRIAIGITQSLIDQFSTVRGNHAIKAGVEIRRLQLIIHDFANAQAGTLTYASLADFQVNKLSNVEYSSELPTKQMRKIGYFGYIQDEWKVARNFTANLGLRYEFYNVFKEIHNRAVPFDIPTCGGFCPAGSAFAFPDTNNLAPRVAFSWAPEALHNQTVVRFGGGIYYGDAQLGDAYSPANNDAQRFSLSSATTPGLAFPIDSYLNPNAALATAPRSMPRNKRNEVSQQWGFTVQQALGRQITFQVGYQGQQNYHVFSRTFANVIDPVTGKRPFPNLDQIDLRGEDGVGSFHGLISTLQVNNWQGWSFQANYMYSHALNDGSSGGGGADNNGAQNVACRSCEKANSSFDATHVLTVNYTYKIPFGQNRWFGGWEWSGISTARTGLPVNVSVSRNATTLADGNSISSQRPDLVTGVPLYLDYGKTGRWLNLAAFAVPAKGTWGNFGRNVLRAPGLFQIDTAISKRTRLNERMGLELGVQAFNILNHPQLGPPAANISSAANFGLITAPVNRTPVGAGTPRQIQFFSRLSF